MQYLSDDAERVVKSIEDGEIDVRALMKTYDSWAGSALGSDEGLEGLAFEDAMLRSVRERLRLRSTDVGWIENVGDALNVVTERAPAELQSEWHDAKVRALNSSDREKRQLVFRHLVATDYEDELVIVALMESLARDDQMLALTFVSTAATQLHPETRADVVDLVVDEIEKLERRRSSKAAFYATLIDAIFENHPSALPGDQLLGRLERIVFENADPASFAAIADIFSRVLQRTGDPSYIERWFTAVDARLWILALSVLHGSDPDLLTIRLREHLHRFLVDARNSFSPSRFEPANLSVDHIRWIESALFVELTRYA